MKVKVVVLACITGLLAVTVIIGLLYVSFTKDNIKGKDITLNSTDTSLKDTLLLKYSVDTTLRDDAAETSMKDITRPKAAETSLKDNARPEAAKTFSKDNARPEAAETSMKDITRPKAAETSSKGSSRPEAVKISMKDTTRPEAAETSLRDSERPDAAKTFMKVNTRSADIKTASSGSKHQTSEEASLSVRVKEEKKAETSNSSPTLSVTSTPIIQQPAIATADVPVSDNVPHLPPMKASSKMTPDDILSHAIFEHLLNPSDPKARQAVEDAKKGSSIENAEKRLVDKFYLEVFDTYCSKCATAVVNALIEDESHEEAYSYFEELLKASTGMKMLGYQIEEPRYPDFILKSPLAFMNYFLEGSMMPHTESANATINQNINRVFAYFDNHLPADVDLLSSKKQETRTSIKKALGELIYIIQIRALSKRNSSEAVDVVVERAHEELHKIIHIYGFPPSDIQSIGSGFYATMTSTEVLALLREKLFAPKLVWGSSLVSAGVPRPILNVNAICYAIATLQCLANFLPLWKMTAMKGIARDPANANRMITRLDQVFELLNQSAGAPLDVTAHISLEGWGDSRIFIFELNNKIKQDNLIPERNLNDLYGVFSSSPLATFPMYSHCKIGVHWNRPCSCDHLPLVARGGLVVYDCNSTASAGTYDVPLSSQFLDLETGRYKPYDLHAFTFGGQIDDSDRSGHTFAYVKRKNDQWYSCNDSRVEEIADDQVPITKALQEHHDKRPLVLFFLRME